jgi:hypothetical protein
MYILIVKNKYNIFPFLNITASSPGIIINPQLLINKYQYKKDFQQGINGNGLQVKKIDNVKKMQNTLFFFQ